VSALDASSRLDASRRDGEDRRLAIGVDVGGTKIAVGVVGSDGLIEESTVIPTPRGDEGDVVLDTLLGLIDEMRARHAGVEAIGVGAPGVIDWPRGHIRWAPNNTYRELPLRQFLAHRSGLPTVVDNDANAAAWAEARIGAGVGRLDVIVLTIGTGVGGGLIMNGMLHRGQSGIGGEVGHIIVNPHGAHQCGCGLTGCLEAMASGTALAREGRSAAAAEPAGYLATLAGGPGEVTSETVFEAARRGDAVARSLFEDLGYWLGVGIASLVTLFDPELVIVGGGLITAGELLLCSARTSFERFVFARPHRTLPSIIPARLGVEAGIIGAALLALSSSAGPGEPGQRQPAGDRPAGT
jgi:glucokinase